MSSMNHAAYNMVGYGGSGRPELGDDCHSHMRHSGRLTLGRCRIVVPVLGVATDRVVLVFGLLAHT